MNTPSDSCSPHACKSLPPLVLVHGLDDTHQVFWTMRRYLEARGWCIYAWDLSPSNGSVPLEHLAQQLADRIKTQIPPDQTFDLLGFSMGGIISRYYLQRLGGLGRVRRFISIASPHQGTWMGYMRWNPGCEQMRPQSNFLQDLNRDWQVLEQVGFTSLWTPFDLMIVPPTSSVLPVGRSIQIPVGLHPWMLTDPRCLEQVARCLWEGLQA